MNEKAIIEEIKSDPSNVDSWLVYSDWLAEFKPKDAELIRKELAHRIPFQPGDFEIYRKSIQHSQAGEESVKKHSVLSQYQDDMERVSESKVLLNLRRQLDGRLPLKRSAILAAYGNDPWSVSRQPCLVVTTPGRRRDKPIVNVRIESLILRNHAQNWTNARWLWDSEVSTPPDPVDLSAVQLNQATAGIKKLNSKNKLKELERRQLAIHLLDQLKFSEAFTLYDISYDLELDSKRAQVPFIPEDPLSPFPKKPNKETKQYKNWVWLKRHREHLNQSGDRLKTELWRSAPWKVREIIDQTFEVRRQTLRTVRECKLRLFALPKQTGSSKFAVFIGCDKSGNNHSIYLGRSATNDHLAEPDWQRDFWFDMNRVGMLEPEG